MSGKHHQKKKKPSAAQWRWVVRVFCVSVALSAILSMLSSMMLEEAGLLPAVLVLLLFILLGILFDIVGVAVTAADPRPFHSMASHKEKGAAEALYLLRNSGKVSNFCNDVVGDICGIVSGTTASVIVLRLQAHFSVRAVLLSIAVTALISGLTIGGKALGKNFALQRCTEVVYRVARLLHIFQGDK